MNWLDEELNKRRLVERSKESESTGRVHKWHVKVSIDGTIMQTAIFAENVTRAKKIAKKLFGQRNIKAPPVKQ